MSLQWWVAHWTVGVAATAATRLGRAASAARTAAEVAGAVTGVPTPWGLAQAGRMPVALAGRAAGLTVRGTFRTGSQGDQTNALSRLVHAADGTHRTGAKAGAARHVADWTGTKVCFAAGTPLESQHGARAVEQFRSYEEAGDDCDRVVSRSELTEDGPLVLRRVLRRFERVGLVLEVRLAGGVVIGTTAEHPFYVHDKGWTAAQELRVGDELRLMGPGWVRVEGVEDTGRVERVYNLEVEGDHTYFVGCAEWGFSVWAHIAACTPGEVNLLIKEVAGDKLNSQHAIKVARFANDADIVALSKFLGAMPELKQLDPGRFADLVSAVLRQAGHDPLNLPPPTVRPPTTSPRVLRDGKSPMPTADQRTPPPFAPIDAVYEVGGNRPALTVDMSHPGWKQIVEQVRPMEGVYIVKDGITHQRYKAGYAGYAPDSLARYNLWTQHGIPAVVEFYPIAGSRIRLTGIETDLRAFLRSPTEHWTLPVDRQPGKPPRLLPIRRVGE